MSASDVKVISDAQIFDQKGRRAIVTARDIDFGMSRMYMTLLNSEPDGVRVFRDMAEARQWLGLEPEAD